jgi:hypothetical protein
MYPITTFVRILTGDSMHPIGHPRHDSNYNFMKIIFYSFNQTLLCNVRAKNFCTHLDKWFYASKMVITWHDSNFKFMNFKFFQKYIQNGSWNVHKNVRSSMMKTIFESDASLRNYRRKTKENYMGCIPTCARQPCQLVSGAIWWNI